MSWTPKKELLERTRTIELLEKFAKFMEQHGYTDTDWWQEEPYAIDEFISEEEEFVKEIESRDTRVEQISGNGTSVGGTAVPIRNCDCKTSCNDNTCIGRKVN